MARAVFMGALAVIVASMLPQLAASQGLNADKEGHGLINGQAIFSFWNPDAGQAVPENLNFHTEFLPNLNGWDFRINVPYTRFRKMREGRGSAPAFAEVVEGHMSDPVLHDHGHVSNSLRVFQVNERSEQLEFKVLPSRRDFAENQVENVSSLTGGWRVIPGPALEPDKLATTVVGEGIGDVRVIIAARDKTSSVLISEHGLDDIPVNQWNGTWESLDVTSASAPATSASGTDSFALAWVHPDDERVRVRARKLSAQWSEDVSGSEAVRGRPRLVWDGEVANLIYVRSDGTLQHQVVDIDASGNVSLGSPRTVLSNRKVDGDAFDVVFQNRRLHVVARWRTEGRVGTLVYASTLSAPGELGEWSVPSAISIQTRGNPEIGYVNDMIYVLGVSLEKGIAYARLDPNVKVHEQTGAPPPSAWKEVGGLLDNRRNFLGLDTASFNSDLYVAASKAPVDDVGGVDTLEIVNFGRHAMKQFLSDLGIVFRWGATGGGGNAADGSVAEFSLGTAPHPFMPETGDVPILGDFNGDLQQDIAIFPQREISGVTGPAPVFVAKANSGGGFDQKTVWHTFFSLKGEIPLVGDFNGDGMDDIITFKQTRQFDSSDNLIGLAPVWVALSNGSEFETSSVWHPSFSLRGEIPMVGDFNGDGMDDIITFVQKKQNFEDGTEIGPAPVWVALSRGSSFQDSKIWHTFFSLKGEIPMVGDFNGDGMDDIVSFVQEPQNNADGSLLGTAPVWVSLSNGFTFQTSGVWHTFFAPGEEVPRVGDVNADGRDDIITFLMDEPTDPNRKRNVLAAFSDGSQFERTVTWISDLGHEDMIPHVGSSSGIRLSRYTGKSEDDAKLIPTAYAIRPNGAVHLAKSLANTPMPSGAPWENYKWFTEKGLGAMMLPAWIWTEDCIQPGHRFVMLGASGSGGATVTNHSPRLGGREGHVLQEVGHSVFAHCFRRETSDPFGQAEAIFGQQELGGHPGFNADDRLLCPSTRARFFLPCWAS